MIPIGCILLCFFGYVTSYSNVTNDATTMQLPEFKRTHLKPIGVLTSSAGVPVDVRETITINTDFLPNNYFFDAVVHLFAERVPERVVHAKGTGAYGYFEVTNDVSDYTYAKVFNGVGKRTPVVTRFSQSTQLRGGTDLGREQRGLGVKFYTEEGNLDLLLLHIPIFFMKDPIDFVPFTHAFRKNPKTNVYDSNMIWDFVTTKSFALQPFLWLLSDYGVPDGFRTMDLFAIHTFKITNKHGENFYARFNFRTEQGLANLTTEQIRSIQGTDLDYYNRDLYNAIDNNDYPSWRLDMDILSLEEIPNLDYNPFDLTMLWKKGTYKTITVGRLVLDRNVDNQFSDVEHSAYNPANLVPGIPGPVDQIFKARLFSYRDAQNYRVGINNAKIEVNAPKYAKTYQRDGDPSVRDNMKDAPNYYPNTFNGPVPYVDTLRSNKKLMILESDAVDLQGAADFYDNFLIGEGPKSRLGSVIVTALEGVTPELLVRVIRLLELSIPDLARRVVLELKTTKGIWLGKRSVDGEL